MANKRPNVLVVKPLNADMSNLQMDEFDNQIFRIYLHGTIQSKFPKGDQVAIRNMKDFDLYSMTVKDINGNDVEIRQIDFEGIIPCQVIGHDKECTAFIWKVPFFSNNRMCTIGLIAENDDKWGYPDAQRQFEKHDIVV